ncbi:SCO family protein [Arenimonas composti]|uniref:Thioredoxin domain-containing protein n=1 Tax=Arenimonas composti TR7-09 = DSM 18010 TaxID=1121013 RepID=A0A091BG05_9GAMM|nr:SCO family protein [Arenimonas composti]KFN49744.1 hypothetical protein P873_09305 [Arenimonas composti TR7-09 = DSM 18010]
MFNRTNLLIVLVALCAGLGLWAGRLYFDASAARAGVGPPATAETPAVAQERLRSVRLHAPRPLDPFVLQQSDGSPLEPADLRGRWTIVFLGFTHCPDVCPTTLQDLAKAQRQWEALPEAIRPQVLFVSVDPERDTPEKTGQYAAFFHPETLAATAPEPALQQFAAGLGLVYMKVATAAGDYTMDHSATLVVLDPQGRRTGVIQPQHAPQPPLDPEAIAADLALLATEAP